MAYRVCITNQKGGTGKTTVSINLAGGLAERGHDVVLIDLDPQGYATVGTGLKASYSTDGATLFEVLLEESATLGDIVQEGPEFDVIPSAARMAGRNIEAQLKQATAGERRLEAALDDLDGGHDVIVIDCPPGLGALTDNALLASRNVVIPAEAKGTSRRALELLNDQIDTLEQYFGADIRPIAVVANEARPDGVSDEMLEWFDAVFGGTIPVYEVRKRVALQRAMDAGRSVFAHDEDIDMAAVFDDLAGHVEQEAGL
ncbi:ParA family protein [Natrialba aegyptia]|uniref:ParA family protein n=1 Tax=Natrialba aegyptia TaxID=129789 RepID=UPI00403B0711